MEPGTFFFPGPAEVSRAVREAMAQDIIPHRSPAFTRILESLQESLQHIFGTARPVITACSSGTGMMEAAIRNSPPGTILSIVNGAFASRFADVARSCGRTVDTLELHWGEIPTPEMLGSALRRSPGGYAAVTVVHSETSTGALTPLAGLAGTAHRHGALLLVDAVSSVGAVDLKVEAQDGDSYTSQSAPDFIFTASQKALALPPGLAFGVVSEAFLEASSSAEAAGTYFSIRRLHDAARVASTAFTPPVSLVYAAEFQCRHIVQETIEARAARHRAMSHSVHSWLSSNRNATGLTSLTPTDWASPTVSVLVLPEGLRAGEVVKDVARRGYTIATGYGERAHDTIRIGHMGDHTASRLEGCLDALGASLAPFTQDPD